MHLLSKSLTAVSLCAIVGTGIATAASEEAALHETRQAKLTYNFPQKRTPNKLLKYSSAFFSVFDNNVSTVQGSRYFDVDKKTIKHVDLSPSCSNYVAHKRQEREPGHRL